MTTPRVFISYSWDSEDHKAWVLSLANRLRSHGVDVKLDQYDLKLGRNLSHYMEQAISEVDTVVLILTENYKIKAEGRKGGVGYEYSMINEEWYEDQADNNKFIPILRSGDKKSSVPRFVRSYTYGDMRLGVDFDKAYRQLLETIYDAPEVRPAELGDAPDYIKNQMNRKGANDAHNQKIENSTSSPLKNSAGNSTTDLINKAENTVRPIGGDSAPVKKMSEFKFNLKMLIGQGKLKEVIDLMLQYAKDKDSNQLINATVLQSGRYHSMMNNINSGLSTREQEKLERAKLSSALISMIESL